MRTIMPNHNKPDLRFVTKGENQEKWTDLGAAWKLSGDKFSARIKTPSGEEISFLIVPNTPKPAKPKAPDTAPAA
jgi:hypothetical protein